MSEKALTAVIREDQKDQNTRLTHARSLREVSRDGQFSMKTPGQFSAKINNHRNTQFDQAHQGDRRDARALRLPADPRVTAAGRLAGQCQADLSDLQELGPAAAEQDAEASGQGEASR